MRRTKNIFIIVVVLALSVYLFLKISSLPSLGDLFTPKKVTIENTPVVVKQIQALAQLVTVSMYEEIVVDSNIVNPSLLSMPILSGVPLYSGEKTLVIIGKVTVHVGIDMQKMSNLDIGGTRDSIHILLPQAEVLDAIINPSDVNIFIEKGDWNNESVINLKNKIRYLAVADAQSRGLLFQSENKAKQILTDFFMAAGYKKAVIQFKGNNTHRD